MSDTDKVARLAELKAKNLPHMNWRVCFNCDGLSKDEYAAFDAYWPQFVHPNGGNCIDCGAKLSGMLGSFVWGIANGEGMCAQCSYPARAHHRNIGPIEFFQAILQYHPETLEAQEVTHE